MLNDTKYPMASYLSLAFLASILIADIYTFVVIKYFKETEGRIKKAIIAALTPAIIFPFTAITKYIVLRKSSEIITPDRAFVLCYFLRGQTNPPEPLHMTTQNCPHYRFLWSTINI
jgi:hypothetical protein